MLMACESEVFDNSHENAGLGESPALATSHPSCIIKVLLLVGQSSPWVLVVRWLVMSVCSWLAGCGPEKLVKCGPQR